MPPPANPLPPGATVGILGGGQLGRMLALAASQLGFKTHIFCPEPDSPAFDVTRRLTLAEYTDEGALDLFARDADAITYEFENIPTSAAAFLRARRPVFPSVQVLETTQDRLTEKTFLADLGIAVAPFRAVDSAAEIAAAAQAVGLPGVLKTRRFGYDGKGQYVLRDLGEADKAWAAVGEAPSVYEGFIDFAREISVIAVRDAGGAFAAYDPPENEHRDQILRQSRVPARISAELAEEAVAIARTVADALDYVGVLAIELFVVEAAGSASLLVNEIAPRVHNSGHWTLDACLVSQFEQHIRAIAGWPLGATARHSDCLMTNLIGADANAWQTLAARPRTALHLYGKARLRPGRKMGHVTELT